MNENSKLKVQFYDTSGLSYTDYTEESFDFSRDHFTLPIQATPSVDYLYIGRRKQFNALYIEIDNDYRNLVATSLTAQYYKDSDSTWTSLPLYVEDTKAFNRSGFIKWELPETSDTDSTSLWGDVAVNSVTRYWIRIAVGANVTSTTKIRGINIVFADDNDLKSEDYGILNYRPKDEDGTQSQSHILSHVAAKEAILDKLNRDGKIKTDAESGSLVNLDEWDLLNVNQIRQAAKYKALSKIYFESSDNKEDVYWAKYEKYESMFEQAYQLYILSLDQNDDGEESAAEQSSTYQGGVFRRA